MPQNSWTLRSAERLYARVLGAMARLLARTGLHPNVVTALSLLPALIAGIAAAGGEMVWAAVFMLLSGLCDILDGALARASDKGSRFGALLDSCLDRISDAAVPAGLVVLWGTTSLVLLPIVLLVSGLWISYIRARAEGLHIELPRLWMRREDRLLATVAALLLWPIDLPLLGGPGAVTITVLSGVAILSVLAGGAALLAAAKRA
ncbi:CDP-alcohol phosphatidyltransferase family protein [Devosia sp. CAU 1758]